MTAHADHPRPYAPVAHAETVASVGQKSAGDLSMTEGFAITALPQTAAALRSLQDSVTTLRAAISRLRAASEDHADAG